MPAKHLPLSFIQTAIRRRRVTNTILTSYKKTYKNHLQLQENNKTRDNSYGQFTIRNPNASRNERQGAIYNYWNR